MERVAPVVDETIAALARTKFVLDPVAGEKYSRATSIVSSAYKRHGRILETAFFESLWAAHGASVGSQQVTIELPASLPGTLGNSKGVGR
jgi:hypothetical protein